MLMLMRGPTGSARRILGGGPRLGGRDAASRVLASRAESSSAYELPADFSILEPFPRGDWQESMVTNMRGDVETPRTESTTLPSGLRVVSQETYTHMSALGVVVEAGSAHEFSAMGSRGGAYLSEMMAWRATDRRSRAELLKKVERVGGFLHANAQREQMLYCVDVLRESGEVGMELLAETVLMPKLEQEEVEDSQRHMELSWLDAPQSLKVRELIHEAAYGKKTPLGSPLMLSDQAQIAELDRSTVTDFRTKLLTPQRTVIAGAGIRHKDLVHLAEKHFEPHWPTNPGPVISKKYDSTYVGGDASLTEAPMLPGGAPDPRNLVHLTLAYESSGWLDSDLVPLCVLQTLLGGGSSFSAGGPGKGMYSRLYREVLNGNYWVESAESFVSVHTDTGLFGISGSCPPDRVNKLTQIFALQVVRLAYEDVSQVELDRAKNMLKINLLTQLESRLALFEDMIRQFSTFGKRQSLDSVRAQIDAVDQAAIRKLGARFLKKMPSVAACGSDLRDLPTAADVRSWYA